jgi:hypothetical protein
MIISCPTGFNGTKYTTFCLIVQTPTKLELDVGIGVTALADLVVKAMRLPGDKSTIEHFMTSDAVQSVEKSRE